MRNTWTRRQAIAGPTCSPPPGVAPRVSIPPAGPVAAHPYKRAAPPCPELHSTSTTATAAAPTQPAWLWRAVTTTALDQEDMERGDCPQFMVVAPAPPPRQQYGDEAAQFMHHLMAAAGEVQDPAGRGASAAGGERSGERKRRFTEEQVRSLETTFHARRAKLEPREKAELARELGLQPRQVAIWFQNKRARWRSKQLEHDYAALRAQYDALHARVDALRQEKLELANQVDELRGRLLGERQDQSGSSCCEVNGGAADDKRNNNNSTSSLVQDDDAGATPPPAAVADASEESAATEAEYCYDHVAYEGLHDPFCATPDLWDTWPLLEWNAVA